MSRRLKEYSEKLGNKSEFGVTFQQFGPAHRPSWRCRVDTNGLSETAEGVSQNIAKEAACEQLLKRLTSANRFQSKLNPASEPYVPGRREPPNEVPNRLLIVRTDMSKPIRPADFENVEVIYFFGPHLTQHDLDVIPNDNAVQRFCLVGQKDPDVTTAAIQLFIGLYHRDYTHIFVGVRRTDWAGQTALRPTIQAAACFGIRITYRYYT
jgi:hypothetical protein